MTQSMRLIPTEPVAAKMEDGVEKTAEECQHTVDSLQDLQVAA
jgi:hypothetical protein